ncbi:MAG: deoxyguanosinetriphosphate triphosphohydrolase [Clostridia bacterium]|nr:deoxyguanosinetriphosphate triphosphohydrolase [Clostridia bacterium]MBQ9848527.1 deoxyguanosinetriphosphate triphosphohydrolase [Clostridia bacterium]
MKSGTHLLEESFLCDKAFLSKNTRGRVTPVPECPVRTEFQRDRDRIIHCKSFRRLMHKMQVFLAPEGDHYRTRLTHTLEVAQIARTIARALRLNEDLTEAAALGHDLGHTPFGHSGERALNTLLPGGFRHNEQSLRVVDYLEREGVGLNLTYEVRDAILCHTGEHAAETLEGRIIKIADRIAYINHDIDDAARAGILTNSDIPKEISDVLGNDHSQRITSLVSATVMFGTENGIGMTEPYGEAMDKLRDFMFERVYSNEAAKSEEGKVRNMLTFLYEHFSARPETIPPEYLKYAERDGYAQITADFIAGMTDRYALGCFNELFVPKVWQYK